MLAVAVNENLPVAAARAGDPGAWDVLFRRYQLPLYTYCYEMVRDEQTSLDIVQETFVSAVRHLAQLREDDKFGGWMFGIARQRCLQHWRRSGRRDRAFQDLAQEDPESAPAPDEWLISREDEARFLDLLDRLSPPHREVLVLHFLEEFPLDDIAHITGTPLGTVKSRLHHAKKQLRELLS